MEINGKTALVTGAAGALGSLAVDMLRNAGASKIFAVDINQDGLNNLSAPNVEPVICDLTDANEVTQTIMDLPPVDILINNAGILHSAPLINIMNKDENRFEEAAAAWQQVIQTNLSSTFYVSQCVVDSMVRSRTKGVIVNISSVSASGTPGQSAYAAAKAGLNALTSVWAKELGPLGIRCAAIAPGYINTASTRKAVSQSQLDTITAAIPLKKLGEAEYILATVRHAIENDYINGTVLEIDGGLVV